MNKKDIEIRLKSDIGKFMRRFGVTEVDFGSHKLKIKPKKQSKKKQDE